MDGAVSRHHGLDERDGFFFPVARFMPSHAVGIIRSVFLAAALLALYVYHLGGSLAMDLRGGCGGGALSQRLRRGSAGVPEGVLPGAAGADPDRSRRSWSRSSW